MSSSLQRGQKKKAQELFSFVSVKCAVVIFPLAIILVANAELIMVLIFGEAFRASAQIFTIYCLLLPCRIVVYGSALVALGKTRLILFRSIGELTINLVLSVLLYNAFGPIGVAVATVISIYAWSVLLNLRSIANGFNVQFSKVLDFSTLGRLAILATITSIIFPIADYIIPGTQQDIVRAGASILYIILMYFLLSKAAWLSRAQLDV